jgi:hypothetical protein
VGGGVGIGGRGEWGVGGTILGRKSRRILRKTCTSATLSTTDLTRPDQASKRPLRLHDNGAAT